MRTKPICNLKVEYLHAKLISFIDRAQECGFNVRFIIFNGASTNCEVVRKLLKV